MDAPALDFRRSGILVLVDHVLVDRQVHQLMDLGIKPGLAKGGEVLSCITVKQQLIADQSKGDIGPEFMFGHSVFRYRNAGGGASINIRSQGSAYVLASMKGHGSFPFRSGGGRPGAA